MRPHTETEENYLKNIYRLSRETSPVATNTLATQLGTSPASVTDMLKRLNEKKLVSYKPYRGVTLTEEGQSIALRIIRKHRLWEVFLVDKLHFSWDNVHEVAEQLEHINSPELIKRIDKFLGYPKFDPHGDPIPNEHGEIEIRSTVKLSEVEPGQRVIVANVLLSDPAFLQYMERIGLILNKCVFVKECLPFDESLVLELDGTQLVVSGSVSKNILVLLESETENS